MAESATPSSKLDADHETHPPHPAVPYLVVWLALLGLTALTYVTGSMHLGAWALPVCEEDGRYLGFILKSAILARYRKQLIQESEA